MTSGLLVKLSAKKQVNLVFIIYFILSTSLLSFQHVITIKVLSYVTLLVFESRCVFYIHPRNHVRPVVTVLDGQP